MPWPMGRETSFHPPRPSFQSANFATPTPTLPSVVHQILPRATPSPTCCSPNQVVVELSTTVLINDYQRYYSEDINSFTPTYYITHDGSLITPALTNDLWNANLNLLLTAAVAMLFVRNIAVAVDYIRRGKMKKKLLFYLLLLSQALAPLSFIPTLVSFFDQHIGCTLVIALSSTVGSVALGVLISGILGIKVYKCMNDSKIVAATVIVLELGHLTFIVLDVVAIRGARRVSGSCLRTSDVRYTQISAALQMVECCIMMLCFVYTCIKYRKTPGARGRISLRMSMDDPPLEVLGGEPLVAERSKGKDDLRSPARRMTSNLPGNDDFRSHAHRSMASSLSRLSRLLSNMVNLKKVMRDELLYTCIITIITTCALIFTFAGANIKNGPSGTGWINLTWCLISLFILHSSGRVVRRHEREALVRYATTRATRNAITMPSFVGESNFWLSNNSPQIRNRKDTNLSDGVEVDPYSEKIQLRQEPRASYQSALTASNLPSPFVEPVVNIKKSNEVVAYSPSLRDSVFPTSGRETPIVAHEPTDYELPSFSQSWLVGQDKTSMVSGNDESIKRTSNV